MNDLPGNPIELDCVRRIMRRVGKFLLGSGIAIGSWLAVCAVIGKVATEGALHPARARLVPAAWEIAGGIAAQDHADLTEASIVAADGSVLRAWSLKPATWNGDSVMLFHGQSDNRAGMLGNAGLLLQHGFAVLLPDSRGHGESGGTIATYGALEADDIRRWYDWLRDTEHPRCIDGLGDSMGGAELLNSLSLEQGFCAVVAESSFATFRDAADVRLGEAFHTGPWLGRTLLRPAVEFGLLYARLKYGVDLAHASPLHAAAESATPVLLIHGRADTNMPPWNSERIRQKDSHAELWEPVDAGHCGAMGAAPAEYERRVIGWFESYNAPPDPEEVVHRGI